MLHASTRRGRPKGTGIDDSDRIARLDELMRVRPDLKPTTAIRLMGYSDPSAIRRLRDKYKIFATSDRRNFLKAFAPNAAPTAARQGEPLAAALPPTQLR